MPPEEFELAQRNFDINGSDLGNRTPWDGSGGGGGGYGYGDSPTAQNIAAKTASLTNDAIKTAMLKMGSNFSAIQQAQMASKNLINQAQKDATSKAFDDWFRQKQAEQSAYKQTRNAMGNAVYGSGLNAFNEINRRVDDRSDVQSLQALRETIQNLYNNLYNTENETWQSWASQRTDMGATLRDIAREGAANVANLSNAAAKAYFNGDTYDPSKNDYLNSQLKRLAPGGDLYLNPTSLMIAGYFRPDGQTAEGNRNAQNRNNSTGQGSTNSQQYWKASLGGYDNRE